MLRDITREIYRSLTKKKYAYVRDVYIEARRLERQLEDLDIILTLVRDEEKSGHLVLIVNGFEEHFKIWTASTD